MNWNSINMPVEVMELVERVLIEAKLTEELDASSPWLVERKDKTFEFLIPLKEKRVLQLFVTETTVGETEVKRLSGKIMLN